MPPDYLPANDAELGTWLANFVTVLNANLGTVGLAPTDAVPLITAQNLFNAALTDQIAKQEAAQAAVVVKKTRRGALEGVLRPLVRRIQNHPGMTDALRTQMGVTVPDRGGSRRGVGEEIPLLHLETRPGQVIVHFGPNPGNERQNGKPAWALGGNVYRKKAGEADFSLIAFDTASPYVDSVADGPVAVTYRVAYRGRRDGDEGAPSAEQSVTAVG